MDKKKKNSLIIIAYIVVIISLILLTACLGTVAYNLIFTLGSFNGIYPIAILFSAMCIFILMLVLGFILLLIVAIIITTTTMLVDYIKTHKDNSSKNKK